MPLSHQSAGSQVYLLNLTILPTVLFVGHFIFILVGTHAMTYLKCASLKQSSTSENAKLFAT